MVSDGTVYYRTRKFADYGKLSHKNLDDLEAGHRSIKVVGDEKEDDFDFVLWKPKKDGEPYWESPWCDGRPGWHIECSVMAKHYLGDEIDIHAGGEDLIKSLGNFFTVREIGEKYDLQVLRFFMIQAHYRSPLNFSAELMEAAKNGLERIRTAASNLQFLADHAEAEAFLDGEEAKLAEAKNYVDKFKASMEDDFNTADAISSIFELVKYANQNADGSSSKAYVQALLDELKTLCDVLGIIVETREEMLDFDIDAMI